jgi:hypothetical protein
MSGIEAHDLAFDRPGRRCGAAPPERLSVVVPSCWSRGGEELLALPASSDDDDTGMVRLAGFVDQTGDGGSRIVAPAVRCQPDDAARNDVDAAGTRVQAGFLSLATFSNASGLERTGSNRWVVSANSGTPAVGVPSAQFGFTTAGAIEMSNVDLAQSFTSMITAQRGFQANSRVISTSDEMLQDLVNLKR